MRDLLNTMLTPAWIVSVVVVGLILNVLSGYLKDGLDILFGGFSNRAARASTRRAEARKALIARLRSDPPFRQQYRLRRLRDAYLAATMTPVSIIEIMVALSPPLSGVGWFFQPPSEAMRVFIVLVGVIILFAGQGFASACFIRSANLIRSEAPDLETVALAPHSDVEVAARP